MTAVVTIDLDDAQPVSQPEEPGLASEVTRRRLRSRLPDDAFGSWIATGVIVLVAAVLRLVGLAWPKGKIFDEVYYATEGHDLFTHGVEWNATNKNGDFVVHPPLGKWIIGVGEQIFGYNEFGWRIMSAVAGILSVLIVIRLARRLFGSTVLGCAAGLLMTLDGLHFVLSRSALLDIFLMLFVLAAFACLVMDRDSRRERWWRLIAAGGDPRAPGAANRPRFSWRDGVPWWRLSAAFFTGCAMSVKWSALWYIAMFVLLIYVWELGARKSAGVRHRWRDTFLDETGWVIGFLAIVVVVYLASWSGWFLTDQGYDRHWIASLGHHEVPVISALQNLYHYHWEALNFHDHLSTKHLYQSWPWQWLLDARPVAFYWNNCSGGCASEVLLLGTPLLWWSFIPALGMLAWFGVSRRDWRTLAIGLGVVCGIVPWFNWELNNNRTMFYFYVMPAEPFLILAVVYVLGCLMHSPVRAGALARVTSGFSPGGYERVPAVDRRMIGAVVAGVYVLIIALCFAYFYPIYVGKTLTYAQWYARMWLGGRWI